MTAAVTGYSGPSVMVVGDVMTDVIVVPAGPIATGTDSPARISYSGGGAGANVAAWLASAGVAVSFIGRAGPDAAAEVAASLLRAAGVRVTLAIDAEAVTGTCVVLIGPGGERTMLPDRGANDLLAPEDVADAAFRRGVHLHLSGYTLLGDGSREAGRSVLARAGAAGMTTSVSAASAAPLAGIGPEAFLGWVSGVDLLVANLDEAAVLTATHDVRAAALTLGSHVREVVVTDGARGAVWSDGWVVASAAAAGVEVVDTAGAGDAFVAGFLAEWLVTPEPETALASGNRLAARAVTRSGARP